MEYIEKEYSKRINKESLADIQKGIHNYIIAGRRYLRTSYTAKQLAADIGTNTRYLSAAIRKKYDCNYADLVNKMRIEDAKRMLSDKNCTLNIDDIAFSCGFGNRQTFYSAFEKFVGEKPKDYRRRFLDEEDGVIIFE